MAQPQGHVQVLLNILRGFSPQAALDAPRFCISPGSPDTAVTNAGRVGDINSEVYFEDGISTETVEKLKGNLSLIFLFLSYNAQWSAMGHDARILSGFARDMFGRGQVIQKINDKSGKTVWAAGSDPRGDGHAAAQI